MELDGSVHVQVILIEVSLIYYALHWNVTYYEQLSRSVPSVPETNRTILRQIQKQNKKKTPMSTHWRKAKAFVQDSTVRKLKLTRRKAIC